MVRVVWVYLLLLLIIQVDAFHVSSHRRRVERHVRHTLQLGRLTDDHLIYWRVVQQQSVERPRLFTGKVDVLVERRVVFDIFLLRLVQRFNAEDLFVCHLFLASDVMLGDAESHVHQFGLKFSLVCGFFDGVGQVIDHLIIQRINLIAEHLFCEGFIVTLLCRSEGIYVLLIRQIKVSAWLPPFWRVHTFVILREKICVEVTRVHVFRQALFPIIRVFHRESTRKLDVTNILDAFDALWVTLFVFCGKKTVDEMLFD